MKKRLLVAAVGVPLLLATVLLLPKWAGAAVVSVICAGITWEFLSPTGYAVNKRVLLVSVLFSFAVSLRSYTGMDRDTCTLGLVLLFLYLAFEFLAAGKEWQAGDVCAVLFGALLLPWLLAAVLRIFAGEDGRALVLIPFALTMVPDAGALAAGMAFGKHPLAPEISPRKTVEGAAGSLLAGLLTAFVYGLVLQGLGFRVFWGAAALYGILGGFFSVVGDLLFSVVKRQRGIKDFSRILSDHGGLLDRFDSLVLFAPVAEQLLRYLPIAVK